MHKSNQQAAEAPLTDSMQMFRMGLEGGKPAKTARSGGVTVRTTGFFATKPRASKSELVIFTRQLSTMISAGISLLEAIEVLTEQAETPGMKACCAQLANELRGGSDLSAAMTTCPKVFTPLYVSMVTAGEASGQMDVILVRLIFFFYPQAGA